MDEKTPVYIIRDPENILFSSASADYAIGKSIELSVGQHEHLLEIWIGERKVGNIELNGEIQNIHWGE